MTNGEWSALLKRVIAQQEYTLRLLRRLRDGTAHDDGRWPVLLEADRRQIAAQQAAIAAGQEE